MSFDSTAIHLLFDKSHSLLGTPMLEIILINLVFTVIAFLFIWSKVQLKLSTQNKVDREIKKRESFKDLLNHHSDLILGKHMTMPLKEWMGNFADMSKNILLWGSDKVILEYGEYVMLRHKERREILEREIHFAKAILAFRKEIGYKNRFNKI